MEMMASMKGNSKSSNSKPMQQKPKPSPNGFLGSIQKQIQRFGFLGSQTPQFQQHGEYFLSIGANFAIRLQTICWFGQKTPLGFSSIIMKNFCSMASASNTAIEAAPFGRWTLRNKAPRRAPYLQRSTLEPTCPQTSHPQPLAFRQLFGLESSRPSYRWPALFYPIVAVWND